MKSLLALSMLAVSVVAQASSVGVSFSQGGFFGIGLTQPAEELGGTFGHLEGSFDAIDVDGDGVISYVADISDSSSRDYIFNFEMTYVGPNGEREFGSFLENVFNDEPEVEVFRGRSISRLTFDRSKSALFIEELWVDAFLNEVVYTQIESDRHGGGLISNSNTNFGDITRQGLKVAVVPLPAAVWLFASALIALFGFSRKKSYLQS